MTKIESIAIRKFKALNKTYLEISDINDLMDCKDSKSSRYRKEFLSKNPNNSSRISTKDFVNHYKIDAEMIRLNYIAVMEVLQNAKSGRL